MALKSKLLFNFIIRANMLGKYMTGRIIVTPFNTQDILEEKVDLLNNLITGFNLAPHQLISIILQDERKENFSLENAFWGFSPSWTNPQDFAKTNFSVAIENIKPASYETLVRTVKKNGKKIPIKHFQKPCLVPVTGFFKWQKLENQTLQNQAMTKQKSEKNLTKTENTHKLTKDSNFGKQIFAIRKESNFMFYLAGIWTSYIHEIDFSCQNSFTLVNTKVNGALEQISQRMPLILDKNSGLEWLKTEELNCFKAPKQELEIYKVSKLVNSPQNNSKEILEPISARFRIEYSV